MISHNIENGDKPDNISPIPYKSKYEYFNPDIENNIDDLSYVYSLPKSGYSSLDYLMKNGEIDSEKVVSEHVEVLLRGNLRSVFLNDKKLPLRVDDFVVIECENSIDLGRVSDFGNKSDLKCEFCEKKHISLCKILRVPDIEELRLFNKKFKDEAEVVSKAKELVTKYSFEMKVTEADWQIDRQRLTIYFTAPQRIDFRELVKDLARIFKARIELRQISSREETKRLGDFVGPCGRELCCTTFLCNFEHITLDHARVQQLSNNISKLSGNCGRLKCCLKYEFDTYSHAIEKYPPIGSIVEFEGKSLKIIKIDIFNGKITTYNDVNSLYENHTPQALSEMIMAGKLILADCHDNTQKYDHFDENIKDLLE